MAKTRQAMLIWSQEDQQYHWHDEQYTDTMDVYKEQEAWLKRLATCSSFSFQGQGGHLTLLKEARPRGGNGYWYAYRRQGRRIAKKYVGRTADLTAMRLEEIARVLRYSPEHRLRVLSNGGAGKAGDGKEGRAADITRQPQNNLAPSLQTPLLVPKFHLPPLHHSLIIRERLLALLDRALEYKLTLVSAPAGFGKTTLVRQWIASQSKHPHMPSVAWVSLDRGDNDPVRFWRYLLTACQVFSDDVAQEALALLLSTPQPPFEAALIDTALTVFLNALSQCEQGGILLLDDYHAITSPRIQQTMTFFLTYLPASIHVVIITRNEPPFSLAGLRARNELCDLRASDLRFSLEETAAFLQQELSISLAPEIIQRIDAYLEGWAAGLRLLLIALQEGRHSQEIQPLLRLFADDQHTLPDYFLTEVFNTLPETLQRFILQTSILTHLTGPLCAAITGMDENESERILETMACANLFLEPLGNAPLDVLSTQPWYRYHGLWAAAMRIEARRRLGEEQLRVLSTRASYWYEMHHLFAEAVESTLYAQDYPRAVSLIERILQEPHVYYQANEPHTLYSWLEQLPETYLATSPILCLGYAQALLYRTDSWRLSHGTQILLEKLFRIAEEYSRRENNLLRLGVVFAFRALAAWRCDDLIASASYARQALTWLSETQQIWRALSLGVVGKVELLYHGHANTGYEILEEAWTLCKATDQRHFRLSRATANMLARAILERGELHRSSEYYQRILHEAREGYVHSDDMAYALSGLAHISYERNELEMAQQQAEEALAIGQYLALDYHEVQATLLLVRIQHAQGQTKAARQRLDTLLARLPSTQQDRAWPLAREILTLQARLALAEDDLVMVQRWLTGLNRADSMRFPFVSDEETLLLARWYLAGGQNAVALQLLQDLERATQEAGRRYSSFKAQVLLAQVYMACGQQEQSRQILLTVLEQTYIERYLRLFLDEGNTMAALLRSLMPYVRQQPILVSLKNIIRAFSKAQGSLAISPAMLLAQPLSLQELRVLHLLLAGRSNARIAHELVISVNTVRTHVQNIYRKLDVHSRAEAIELAHQFHLTL